MPIITIDGPKIADLDKKRELVTAVTEAAVKAFDLPTQAFVVQLKENAPENVAVGGVLLIDRT